MFNALISYSVKNRFFVLTLTVVFAFSGWFAFRQLPIDAIPDITETQVVVNTSVRSLAPAEIEKYITFPIEASMGGLTHVKEVRSLSKFGLSQITIIFEEGTDIYWARQIVAERLQSVTTKLPKDIQPELGPISSGLGEIYMYTIRAKHTISSNSQKRLKQLMELRSLQDWFIKPRLLAVKGVAEVNSQGGYKKQIYVQPSIDKLSQFGIHIEDLIKALEMNNKNTGGGYIEQTAEQFLVQGKGLLNSIDEIKKVAIKKLPNQQTIAIGDVATVKYDKELRTGSALINGEESILGTVMMLLGENSRTVSIDVDQKIKEIKKALPKWVELEILYNRSDLVNKTLTTIQKNILFGAALVIFFLLLLIGNIRVAIITAIVIPLSLLLTFIAMKIFGISGNLMSLGALDFGIIIDGAVIVMDNCVRHIRNEQQKSKTLLSRREIANIVTKATIEIRSAVGLGQLIIVVVFIPLFFLTGIEGKMFTPMASTFCAALVFGFILSFTTVPAMAATFLTGKIANHSSWLMNKFEKLYSFLQILSLKKKQIIVISSVLLLIFSGWLFTKKGSEFLPQLDEGAISFQMIRSPEISLQQSIELQKLSEKIILTFPEVSHVFSRIGTAEIATDPMGINISDTYIMLKNSSEWPKINNKKRNKDQLIKAIREKVNGYVPGQNILVSQPIQLRFNELMEGVRADISLKIFGDDMATLLDISEEAAKILKTVKGAGDVEQEFKRKSPLLTITPRNATINSLGIAKSEILDTIEIAIGGKEASSIFEGSTRVPILIRLTENDRNDIETIKQIPIGAADNFTVPLSSVADIQFSEMITSYKSETSKKRSAVMINTRGRDTASFVNEAKKKLQKKLSLPNGYYMEWGGNFKNYQKARQQLAIIMPITLVVVLAMIYLVFGSFVLTLIIFFTIPFSMIGGIIGLTLYGLPFSLSAGVGFIALFGIAVLNGVVLVSYLNHLKSKGMSGDELIKKATKIRLRPIMMTALTDIFGFIPMAVSVGAGAEIQRPLAVVIIGGITTSTFLTLFLLPIIYSKVIRLHFPKLKSMHSNFMF